MELSSPTIDEPEVMEIKHEIPDSWINPLIEYLKSGNILPIVKEPSQFRIKTALYVLLDGELFKKESEVNEILKAVY